MYSYTWLVDIGSDQFLVWGENGAVVLKDWAAIIDYLAKEEASAKNHGCKLTVRIAVRTTEDASNPKFPSG